MIKSQVWFIFALIFVAFIYSQDIDEERIFKKYKKFVETYNRNYTTFDEMTKRYEIFKGNYILAVSLRDPNSTEKVTGVTQFMDLTDEEFREQYTGYQVTDDEIKEFEKHGIFNTNETYINNQDIDIKAYKGRTLVDEQGNPSSSNSEPLEVLGYSHIPSEWDWRSKGAVTTPRNQGVCGACWTFAANVNLEALYFFKTGKLKVFSEQQLLDCVPKGNLGCRGGIIRHAFDYLKTAGINLGSSYPYVGYKGYCKAKYSTTARTKGWISSGTTDENYIKTMLYQTGPLSVPINSAYLRFYKGGVLNLRSCPATVDHGVAIVGYGSSRGVKYWIVKNSWGPYWGEGGYFRIVRGRGHCGINKYAYSAVLA